MTKTTNTTTRILDNIVQNSTITTLNNSAEIINKTSPILENGTHITSLPYAISASPFRIGVSSSINSTNSGFGDDD